MRIADRLKYLLACTLVLLSILPIQLPVISPHLGNDLALAGMVTAGSDFQGTPLEDKLIIGSSFTLNEGEVISGSLYVLGGHVKVSSGATVMKDIVIIGGNLEVDGTVGGDIDGVGGVINLGATTHIQGDVNTISSYLTQNETAKINGKVNSTITGPFSSIFQNGFQIPKLNGIPSITIPDQPSKSASSAGLDLVGKLLWWLIRSFIWAALAVLAVLFFPSAVDRIAGAIIENPIACGGLGLVTVVIAPFILILLAITICALPVSLVLTLIMVVAWILGFIALGAETGKRLIGKLRLDWATPVSAAIGTFGLTLLSNGIGLLVPCVGWIVSALIGVIGLGAVILTRFGLQEYSGTRVIRQENANPPPG